jgi:kynurenine formamidase
MEYKYLSHTLTDHIPAYGGTVSLDLQSVKALSRGDSANVYEFSMQNHWGTHIDAPNHFFEQGRRIVDYPAETWLFQSPQIVPVDLKPGEILNIDDWSNHLNDNTDILLFKSGWTAFRDRSVYCMENPGLHPNVGFFIRKQFPGIRAVGVDWVSISSYRHRKLGRESHRAFLDPEGENDPVFLIEDLNLSIDLECLTQLMVVPLFIEGMDSAPCTVLGRFNG